MILFVHLDDCVLEQGDDLEQRGIDDWMEVAHDDCHDLKDCGEEYAQNCLDDCLDFVARLQPFSSPLPCVSWPIVH